jgi:hypothetical protein
MVRICAEGRDTHNNHCPLNQLNSKLYFDLDMSKCSAAAGPYLSGFVQFWNMPTLQALYLDIKGWLGTARIEKEGGSIHTYKATCHP